LNTVILRLRLGCHHQDEHIQDLCSISPLVIIPFTILAVRGWEGKDSMVVSGRKSFCLIVALLTLMALSQTITSAQTPSRIPAEARLTLSQVVEKLVQKNAERAKALESYRGQRVYQLEYSGFPKTLRAEMVVQMTYHAPGQKEFNILSESGSKWIVKRVLKRLIDEESEAQQPSKRLGVELSSRNYEFTSLEYQSSASGCTYILDIHPKAPDKFLYRGRIWVDEKDFAVCRIEAEPAKNPSI
jgi:outer membrane lipoprotein-sorting protein